eukprot:11088353-Heterocapsa_arctica.AAC.1
MIIAVLRVRVIGSLLRWASLCPYQVGGCPIDELAAAARHSGFMILCLTMTGWSTSMDARAKKQKVGHGVSKGPAPRAVKGGQQWGRWEESPGGNALQAQELLTVPEPFTTVVTAYS